MLNEVLNEGLLVSDSKIRVKSEVLNQIRRLGPTKPEELERAVFKSLVGHDRDQIDWSMPDNQAGYYTWIKSFDALITELIEDNAIVAQEDGTLVPTEAEPRSDYSHLVYPPRPSS